MNRFMLTEVHVTVVFWYMVHIVDDDTVTDKASLLCPVHTSVNQHTSVKATAIVLNVKKEHKKLYLRN